LEETTCQLNSKRKQSGKSRLSSFYSQFYSQFFILYSLRYYEYQIFTAHKLTMYKKVGEITLRQNEENLPFFHIHTLTHKHKRTQQKYTLQSSLCRRNEHKFLSEHLKLREFASNHCMNFPRGRKLLP